MKRLGLVILLLTVLLGYGQQLPAEKTREQRPLGLTVNEHSTTYTLKQDVRIRDYFGLMDRLAAKYGVSEHLIVHANRWIIDSLADTDYYSMKEEGLYIFDQTQWVILQAGAELLIPGRNMVKSLSQQLSSYHLDINIPEFKLRVFSGDSLLYVFPVRVGQNKHKYLAMVGRLTDLGTQPGKGEVVRHERHPAFYNPVNGHRFYMTRRDDDSLTVMPQIPWIETEINGVRNGQMIHPTTNPETLLKAYSNGCIGLGEGDAWRVYYHVPVGTIVTIRYELNVPDGMGGVKRLNDIYDWVTKRDSLLKL